MACFYYCGILEDDAAIYYQLDAHSPGHLSKDPTFGLFLGHIEAYEGYKVPEDDEFINSGRYHEVYPWTVT